MKIWYIVKWHIKMVAFQNSREMVNYYLNGQL